MKCRKCDAPLFAAPTPAPAWADPRAVMAQCAIRIHTVNCSVFPAISVLGASADPKRVAIGFSCGESGANLCGVTTDPTADGWRIGTLVNQVPPWFTIFEYGPLVNMNWYLGSAATTVTVYEVYRLQ